MNMNRECPPQCFHEATDETRTDKSSSENAKVIYNFSEIF